MLNAEEKQALLGQFNIRYHAPLRNLCMIRLMLEAGLRCGEVISLEVNCVDLAGGSLKIRGVRAQDRIVPIADNLVHLMLLWMDRRPEGRWLFSTRDGNQLSTRYVRDMVKRYAKKAAIAQAESISPRVLRHTYAVDLYSETRDLGLLQRRLGHKYRSSTISYMRMMTSAERKRYEWADARCDRSEVKSSDACTDRYC